MIHNLQTIAVTSMAMFALSAVAASAAEASAFTAESSPTTLKSKGTSEFQTLRVNSSVAFVCKEISLTNSTFTGTSVSGVTVTPHWTTAGRKCESEPFGETEWATNECTYTFHAASSEVNIGCGGGKAIEIKAPGCTMKVGAQNTAGASYANGVGEINLTLNIPIAYTASGLLCGTLGVPSSSTGAYTGTVGLAAEHGIAWDA